MRKIYFKDILSADALESLSRCERWSFEKEKEYDDHSWNSGHYWNAHNGELLFSISGRQPLKPRSCAYEKTFTYPYYAQCSGLYFIPYDNIDILYCHSDLDDKYFYILDSRDEIGECIMEEKKFKYSIEEDLFDGSKKLTWEPQNEIEVLGNQDYLGVYADETGVYLNYKSVMYQTNHLHPKRISPNAGKNIIKIAILFEDKEQLIFEIKEKPRLGYDWFGFLFLIDEKTVQRFCDNNVIAIKVFINDGTSYVIKDDQNQYEDQRFLFRTWFKKSIQIYEQLGFKAEKEIAEDVNTSTEKCFVYLMYDEKNGYYKIGISNNPQYRERTLQSEKPSIRLLCAKDFPARIIAEAIEGALHKAFAAKHMRGEWFNLEAQDVANIIKTLS